MQELFFAPREKTHFLKKNEENDFWEKFGKKRHFFENKKNRMISPKRTIFCKTFPWENLKKNYIFVLQKRNFFSYKNWRKQFFYLNKNKKSFSPRKIVQKNFLKTILFCSKKNSWKIEENNFAQKNSKKQMNFLRKKNSENDLFFCIKVFVCKNYFLSLKKILFPKKIEHINHF